MNNKLIVKVIAGLAGLGLLAGVVFAIYFSGNRILPNMILLSYQEKNCQNVASFSEIFNRFYPEDTGITSLVRECNDYSAAIDYKENGEWQNAYVAFKNYPDAYPTGVFVNESYEEAAHSLVRLANEQYQNRQYDEAVKNLQIATTVYGFTTNSQAASDLLISVYTDWANELRATGNFEKSEKILLVFRAWSEAAGQTEKVITVDLLLAQTYLAWAQFLYESGEYELANRELQKTVEVTSDEEAIVQAQNQFLAVYTAWTNSLLEQGNFEPAIEKLKESMQFVGEKNQLLLNKSIGEAYIRWAQSLLAQNHYEMAIARLDDGLLFMDEKGQATARNLMADTYILWAQSLMQKGDFIDAIEKLNIASTTLNANQAVMKSIQDARKEIYNQFSQSSGEQAQQVMNDATKKLCERNESSSLPVFGINTDKKNFMVYGANISLPDTLTAKVPADLRYVACVNEYEERVETKSVRPYVLPKNPKHEATVLGIMTVTRTQYIWEVKLMDITTGTVIAPKKFEGPTPSKFPYRILCYGGLDCMVWVKSSDFLPYSVQGARPDINLLINWLLSVIQ